MKTVTMLSLEFRSVRAYIMYMYTYVHIFNFTTQITLPIKPKKNGVKTEKAVIKDIISETA